MVPVFLFGRLLEIGFGVVLRIAIPMPLAEALGIKAGDYLDLEVSGKSLSIDLKK
jgi:antitoxin component of MazEF toxin-antitoxin module